MSKRSPRLHFGGGPLDGLVLPWPRDCAVPDEIVFRCFTMHRPARDVVYRLQLAALNLDFVKRIRRYRCEDQSTQLSRLYNIELDRTQRLTAHIEALDEIIRKLRERIRRSQAARKAAKTRKRKKGTTDA